MVTGSADGTVKVWDTESKALLRSINHESFVRSVCVLPCGDLVTGCEDSSLRIFSEKDLSLKKLLKGHKFSIYSIQVIPTGELVTCSADKRIYFWNIKSGM